MKTLGNIIWVIFGGLHIALEYFIAGLVLMITIIGIPFGLQSIKLGMLAIWPFGTKVQWNMDLAHPHLLRYLFLHHHYRHPVREDALPTGKAGPVTLR